MIKPLTSLRFIFALMVFLSHCFMLNTHFEHFFYKEGYVGVTFFFILSGFIIAYSYQDRFIQNKVSKKEFWIARIARIYPLHIFTLLLVALFGGYVFSGFFDWLNHFIPNLLLLQSFIPYHDFYFSFNSPSWALGVEQLFYLLFPFLAFYFGKRFKLLSFIVIGLFILFPVLMRFTDTFLEKAIWYVNPLVRMTDFLIGIFLYNLYDKYKKSNWTYKQASCLEMISIVIFVSFILMAYNGIRDVYRYSFFYWLPISFIIFVFARQRGILSQLLSYKYFLLLGKVSFGFYMYHFFVIKAYIHLKVYLQLNIPFQLDIFIVLLLVIILSLLSYRFFEEPIRRFIRQKFK